VPVIPALGTRWQEELEFQASLDNTGKLCLKNTNGGGGREGGGK
jgi:hypothetical protein